MTLAPIVLFVYNRPWHTQQTIEALQKNSLATDSELFIYSDAPKNDGAISLVKDVREYIKSIKGFKNVSIIERRTNYGLANSIIDGVTKITNEFGKVIVLEDDLVTSPYFLNYMNDGLLLYENDEYVASIHGYIYPIDNLPKTFFIKGADCWGWATWKRVWDMFETDGNLLLEELKSSGKTTEANFNDTYLYSNMLQEQVRGKNDSWAVRWYMTAFLKNMLTLYPGKSLIQNIGLDGSGTHGESNNSLMNETSASYERLETIPITENLQARGKMEQFFRSSKQSIIRRIINKFNSTFK